MSARQLFSLFLKSRRTALVCCTCPLIFSTCLSQSTDRFEGTNTSITQARKDSTFLTDCTITPGSLTADGLVWDVKEAFIARRFSINSRDQELQHLTGSSAPYRLVITPNKSASLQKLWVAEASLKLRDAPGSWASGVGGDIVVIDLPQNYEKRQFAMLLEVENSTGVPDCYNFVVQPRLAEKALAEKIRFPAPPQADNSRPAARAVPQPDYKGFEEQAPLINPTAADSRQAGTLLATCTAAPMSVEPNQQFRLNIDQLFIERQALIASVSGRITSDVSGHYGPRLIIACKEPLPGGLGTHWDLSVKGNNRRLAYRWAENSRLLVIPLDPEYLTQKFELLVSAVNAQGTYEEQIIAVQPTSRR